jgi:hypothetical protein
MPDMHYGVVLIRGRWRIIGEHLSYGAFEDRKEAERAATRLAELSAGLPVQLHVQDELGRLNLGSRIS